MIYKVVVTETQRMTIKVEANTPEEAERRAEEIHEAELLNMNESQNREWDCKSLGEYICPECGSKMTPAYEYGEENGDGEDHYWFPDWLICSKCNYEE